MSDCFYDGRKVNTHAWGAPSRCNRHPSFQIDIFFLVLASLSRPPSDSVRLISKGLYMKRKRGRDSVNGRFIPLEEAKRRPNETVIETVKKPCPQKSRKDEKEPA